MAVTTAYEYRLAIKADLLGRYEEIKEQANPDDYLRETADSWLPVYNGEIIALWSKEMPNDFDDTWQEIGTNENATIVTRMTYDIYNWLFSLTNEIWSEIETEKEEVL